MIEMFKKKDLLNFNKWFRQNSTQKKSTPLAIMNELLGEEISIYNPKKRVEEKKVETMEGDEEDIEIMEDDEEYIEDVESMEDVEEENKRRRVKEQIDEYYDQGNYNNELEFTNFLRKKGINPDRPPYKEMISKKVDEDRKNKKDLLTNVQAKFNTEHAKKKNELLKINQKLKNSPEWLTLNEITKQILEVQEKKKKNKKKEQEKKDEYNKQIETAKFQKNTKVKTAEGLIAGFMKQIEKLPSTFKPSPKRKALDNEIKKQKELIKTAENDYKEEKKRIKKEIEQLPNIRKKEDDYVDAEIKNLRTKELEAKRNYENANKDYLNESARLEEETSESQRDVMMSRLFNDELKSNPEATRKGIKMITPKDLSKLRKDLVEPSNSEKLKEMKEPSGKGNAVLKDIRNNFDKGRKKPSEIRDAARNKNEDEGITLASITTPEAARAKKEIDENIKKTTDSIETAKEPPLETRKRKIIEESFEFRGDIREEDKVVLKNIINQLNAILRDPILGLAPNEDLGENSNPDIVEIKDEIRKGDEILQSKDKELIRIRTYKPQVNVEL